MEEDPLTRPGASKNVWEFEKKDAQSKKKTFNISQPLGDGSCTVLYTNADGLLNKKHELLNFVVDKSPKIIAITEGNAKNQLHANNAKCQVGG